MIPNKHDLKEEFPTLGSRLQHLDTNDPSFHSSYVRYKEVDREIIHHETEAGCSDIHLDNLKKQRLKLKDKLYYLMTHP